MKQFYSEYHNDIEFVHLGAQLPLKHNSSFNYGEFAIIKSQAGLNSYKLSVKKWVSQLMLLVSSLKQEDMVEHSNITNENIE